MIYVVEPIFFNFLRKKVYNGTEELDIGEYRLMCRYAAMEIVENGIQRKEKEVKDVKRYLNSIHFDRKDSQVNVNELTFDVTNIDKDFVTQVKIDKKMGLMYILPDRPEKNADAFLKALSEYITKNKAYQTKKVVK